MNYACLCGSGSDYNKCCGPYIAGLAAPTAEALMRSRYTAHCLKDTIYLSETLDSKSRLREDFESEEVLNTDLKWVGLEILNTSEGNLDDEIGTVEFVAKYKADGNFGVHHERSNFQREAGRWVCVGGEINPKQDQRIVKKIGRNELCPCRSGKKYKKCCATKLKKS